ncbi:unnamed protein product [Staurois parvus]|uniref:Uncharacterized protein n=1 Tax=Staurois parvus TaxID=386267 RepID=A0ABN9C7R7_9NEOB|nr:unnamed protein product [Staurois parvus]
MTAGTGSPGIRSFGLSAGTASSGKAVGTGSPGISGLAAGIWSPWHDSGHWVTRHQVIWLASGHRVIIWINSGRASDRRAGSVHHAGSCRHQLGIRLKANRHQAGEASG